MGWYSPGVSFVASLVIGAVIVAVLMPAADYGAGATVLAFLAGYPVWAVIRALLARRES